MRDHCPNAFLTPSDVCRAVDFVARKGALLFLAVAFLRRTYTAFERDEERDAVDALEAHALHLVPAGRAVEALARAEDATQGWFWAHWSYCPCFNGCPRRDTDDEEDVAVGAELLDCARTRLHDPK